MKLQYFKFRERLDFLNIKVSLILLFACKIINFCMYLKSCFDTCVSRLVGESVKVVSLALAKNALSKTHSQACILSRMRMCRTVRAENDETNHLENNIGQGAMPLGQLRSTSSSVMSHTNHGTAASYVIANGFLFLIINFFAFLFA